MIKHLHVPEMKAFFQAQEDCCFTIVSYDENDLGIVSKIDGCGYPLDSSILICQCHPSVNIIEVTEKQFEEACEKVTLMMIKKGLCGDC